VTMRGSRLHSTISHFSWLMFMPLVKSRGGMSQIVLLLQD
jgi:hypothetical protein